MKRLTVLLLLSVCACLVVTAGSGAATAAGSDKGFKFEPTINAPWAHEGEDEGELDAPDLAAGLCRSAPFNLPGAYAPVGSEVDAIVGDAVNNSGFSNLGCTTPQNETTIAVNPTNPNNVIALRAGRRSRLRTP